MKRPLTQMQSWALLTFTRGKDSLVPLVTLKQLAKRGLVEVEVYRMTSRGTAARWLAKLTAEGYAEAERIAAAERKAG